MWGGERIEYRIVGEALTAVAIDQVRAVPVLAGVGYAFIDFKVAVFTIVARSTGTLIVIKLILHDKVQKE
jgi:hypothetical protein